MGGGGVGGGGGIELFLALKVKLGSINIFIVKSTVLEYLCTISTQLHFLHSGIMQSQIRQMIVQWPIECDALLPLYTYFADIY